MRPTRSFHLAAALAGVVVLATAPSAPAQEASTPLDWAKGAARGVLDLCRQDAPDAAAVAEHGEVWGWPTFVPYLEHPEGYKREAGGESRRSYTLGETTAEVEVTVQSGRVIDASPANVHYFRCDIAANQPIEADLSAYFTDAYGAPASKTDKAVVWLVGAAAGQSPDGDAAALAAVKSAGVGADGLRIELSREMDRDRAKITEFRNTPPDGESPHP
jgi:hypothetical protein